MKKSYSINYIGLFIVFGLIIKLSDGRSIVDSQSETIKNACPKGKYYDNTSGNCLDFPGNGEPVYVDYSKRCSQNFLGIKPHPEESQYYYVCKQHSVVIGRCYEGDSFIPESNCCETTPEMLTYSTENLPACAHSGRFPVPNNCSLYYICDSNGKQYSKKVLTCPGSMVFCPLTQKCSYNYNCVPTMVFPQYFHESHDGAKFPPCKLPGKFRSPDDCSLYYTCSAKTNGKFYQTRYRCPEGTLYDLRNEECQGNNTVKCDYLTSEEILQEYESIHTDKKIDSDHSAHIDPHDFAKLSEEIRENRKVDTKEDSSASNTGKDSVAGDKPSEEKKFVEKPNESIEDAATEDISHHKDDPHENEQYSGSNYSDEYEGTSSDYYTSSEEKGDLPDYSSLENDKWTSDILNVSEKPISEEITTTENLNIDQSDISGNTEKLPFNPNENEKPDETIILNGEDNISDLASPEAIEVSNESELHDISSVEAGGENPGKKTLLIDSPQSPSDVEKPVIEDTLDEKLLSKDDTKKIYDENLSYSMEKPEISKKLPTEDLSHSKENDKEEFIYPQETTPTSFHKDENFSYSQEEGDPIPIPSSSEKVSANFEFPYSKEKPDDLVPDISYSREHTPIPKDENLSYSKEFEDSKNQPTDEIEVTETLPHSVAKPELGENFSYSVENTTPINIKDFEYSKEYINSGKLISKEDKIDENFSYSVEPEVLTEPPEELSYSIEHITETKVSELIYSKEVKDPQNEFIKEDKPEDNISHFIEKPPPKEFSYSSEHITDIMPTKEVENLSYSKEEEKVNENFSYSAENPDKGKIDTDFTYSVEQTTIEPIEHLNPDISYSKEESKDFNKSPIEDNFSYSAEKPEKLSYSVEEITNPEKKVEDVNLSYSKEEKKESATFDKDFSYSEEKTEAPKNKNFDFKYSKEIEDHTKSLEDKHHKIDENLSYSAEKLNPGKDFKYSTESKKELTEEFVYSTERKDPINHLPEKKIHDANLSMDKSVKDFSYSAEQSKHDEENEPFSYSKEDSKKETDKETDQQNFSYSAEKPNLEKYDTDFSYSKEKTTPKIVNEDINLSYSKEDPDIKEEILYSTEQSKAVAKNEDPDFSYSKEDKNIEIPKIDENFSYSAENPKHKELSISKEKVLNHKLDENLSYSIEKPDNEFSYSAEKTGLPNRKEGKHTLDENLSFSMEKLEPSKPIEDIPHSKENPDKKKLDQIDENLSYSMEKPEFKKSDPDFSYSIEQTTEMKKEDLDFVYSKEDQIPNNHPLEKNDVDEKISHLLDLDKDLKPEKPETQPKLEDPTDLTLVAADGKRIKPGVKLIPVNKPIPEIGSPFENVAENPIKPNSLDTMKPSESKGESEEDESKSSLETLEIHITRPVKLLIHFDPKCDCEDCTELQSLKKDLKHNKHRKKRPKDKNTFHFKF